MLSWLRGKGAEVLTRFADERARAEAEQAEQPESLNPQAVMDAIDEHAAKVGLGAKTRRTRKGGEA